MQTPNKVLNVEDVPSRHRTPQNGIEYPACEQFTIQYLEDFPSAPVDNNSCAAFKRGTNLPKPSALLLHYMYGSAVLQQWGQQKHYLVTRNNLPRPSVPQQNQPNGPPRRKHNRSDTIRKFDKSKAAGSSRGAVGGSTKGRTRMIVGD